MKNIKIIKSLVVILVFISFIVICNISMAETKNQTISNSVIASGTISKNENNVADTTSGEKELYQEDVIGMANKLLKENEKKAGKYYYPSSSKYPNAGLEQSVFVPIIKTLIGLLVIALVVMIIKVRKYKRD